MISSIGTFLAIVGSLLSIEGTLINNLLHRHRIAMYIWMLSNPMLALWATGYLLGWWDGALSVLALLGMYVIFTVTNLMGLVKYRKRDERLICPHFKSQTEECMIDGTKCTGYCRTLSVWRRE